MLLIYTPLTSQQTGNCSNYIVIFASSQYIHAIYYKTRAQERKKLNRCNNVMSIVDLNKI